MQIFEITEGILKGMATPSPSYKPAGFATNAAEYFAKSILDKAGIPAELQGQYDPTGHVAASQRKGTASINKQEINLARQLSREYASQKSLNNKFFASQPSDQDIQDAVVLANKISGNEQNIDVAKVSDQIKQLLTQPATQTTAQPTTASTTTAPAPTVAPKTRTGGKVAGQLSQTPNAIRKRQARAAAKSAATTPAATTTAARDPGAQAFGSMAQQLQQPRAKAPVTAPAKMPKPTANIKASQAGAPTPAEYANLEKRLQQALQRKQTA